MYVSHFLINFKYILYCLHAHADFTDTKMFKKISKKPVRVRKDSDEEHSDGEDMNKDEFEKTRELQKLRKRAAGTNIETLGSGKKQNVAEDDDPLGLKKGGMMDVKAMKNYKKEDDAYDVGTQFSKETHIRDEDDEMRKFIETEMSKVKGGAPQPEAEEDNTEEFLSPEDAALMSLPEHLTRSTFKKVIEEDQIRTVLFYFFIGWKFIG